MRKTLTVLASFLLALTVFAEGRGMKVIAIGNSFTQDACEQNLWDLFNAAGTECVVANLYIGGCTLERHCRNIASDAPAYSYRKIGHDGVKRTRKDVSISEALAEEEWDAVVFQQGHGGYGVISTHEPWLGQLMDYVRERVPEGTRFLLQESWAFAEGSQNQNFKLYGDDQWKMYGDICSTTAYLSSKYGLEPIPTATAIQNDRSSEIRSNVTRDGYHLNYLGRYTAACTWFGVLTGTDAPAWKPAEIEDWQAETAREAARQAILHPGTVTAVGPEKYPTLKNESGVPSYTLPEALVMEDGTPVRNAEEWEKLRRKELLDLFSSRMYGYCPEPSADMHWKVTEQGTAVFGGLGVRRQVDIFLDGSEKYCLHLVMYLPAKQGPSPVFLGVNFQGNWALGEDDGIPAPELAQLRRYGIIDDICVEWPLRKILSSGYGVASFYRGDVDPDFDDGYLNGIAPLIYRKGQRWPEPDQWGTVAQWAWSLSRAMDYLETDTDVDASRVAVIGHSRLGKAALWAGAQDTRFNLVISNCSGEGGAALSRRRFGETVQDLNRHFPHWFCRNFRSYDCREDELPFDQHELLALVAPRALYVASAKEDSWADPKGEFLSAKKASEVYEFLGVPGLKAAAMPRVGKPSMEGKVAYHVRKGRHDCLPWDWEQYIKFADKVFAEQ